MVCSFGLWTTVAVMGFGAPATSQPAGKVAKFADGVMIDWKNKEVEVDADVVLVEGALELLACSRGTKEHESILRIRARPLNVLQALGMLGLPDGAAPRFDMQSEKAVAARGSPVDVLVRYERDGKTVTEDSREWLLDFETKKPLAKARWYYVGAAWAPRNGGERFGADLYGTVACLMPFNTAILLLAPAGKVLPPAASQPAATSGPAGDSEYHNTPDDWQVVPNKQRVPPLKTRVTLIIRPKSD